MKRTTIYSLTNEHGPQAIEESYLNEPAPKDMVYIDVYTWEVITAELVSEIPAHALELPKTTWY